MASPPRPADGTSASSGAPATTEVPPSDGTSASSGAVPAETAESSAVDLAVDLSRYQLGWHDDVDYVFKPTKGLSADIVREMSWMKGEPDWMLQARLRSLGHFGRRPMPTWGGDMSGIDFSDIFYYIKPTDHQVDAWDELPEAVKRTYEKLGIPEAERKYLAGVTAQYESEVVFHRNRADLEARGVIFCDMDTALREYPELVKRYWGRVIPPNDNKFAALNTAVWSGGSFIYVPPGVNVEMPLQAYFRINAENMGQFERTLIIADEGSQVHYIEGCLLEGERIELPDGGWRPVEDVAPKDVVVGHDGRPARVVEVMKRDYRGQTYTVTPLSSANAFTVTSEHPILAVRRGDVLSRKDSRHPDWKPEVDTAKLVAAQPAWVRADELREGDFLVFPKRRPAAAAELDPAFVRLAGYFLAEGHCSVVNGCKALVFSFHHDEQGYVDEVQSLAHALWGKRGSVYRDPAKHEARVTVYTNEGYDLMQRHCGSGAAGKRVSAELFSQDDARVSALVDAYVNGDGNRNPTSAGWEWVRCHTVSQDWAFQLQALLGRLDVFATVRLARPGGTGVILAPDVRRQDLWVVQWRTNKRTGEVRDAGDYFLVPVKRIDTEDFEGPVFNFETEGVHSYLVKGFATHNCSAPVYTTDSLHSAVVEIVVKPSARVTYTTIQNWSNNVYNLVTKRARVEAEGHMEWIDGNIGCLASGSNVYTPAGPKPIEDVVPGERVASFGGDQLVWAKVTAKRFSGVQPTHEVTCGERRLWATANHPFYTPVSHAGEGPPATGVVDVVAPGEGAWVRVDALAEAGRVLLPRMAPKGQFLPGAPLSLETVTVSETTQLLPTWDIEVEGTGCFVAEGFLVHNSRLTMKYPAVYLVGPKASGEVLSVAYAGSGQHQDAGAKMVHAAAETTSKIVSKSISKDGGRTSYRGLVRVEDGADGCRSHVQCDALILDDRSTSDTFPYMEVGTRDAVIGHEATVSKVADEQLFYLMSRGLSEEQAMGMIVNGFIEPVTRTLPMEYAVEWSRLIELQMDGSVG